MLASAFYSFGPAFLAIQRDQAVWILFSDVSFIGEVPLRSGTATEQAGMTSVDRTVHTPLSAQPR